LVAAAKRFHETATIRPRRTTIRDGSLLLEGFVSTQRRNVANQLAPIHETSKLTKLDAADADGDDGDQSRVEMRGGGYAPSVTGERVGRIHTNILESLARN
jgi:hypothetical protein